MQFQKVLRLQVVPAVLALTVSSSALAGFRDNVMRPLHATTGQVRKHPGRALLVTAVAAAAVGYGVAKARTTRPSLPPAPKANRARLAAAPPPVAPHEIHVESGRVGVFDFDKTLGPAAGVLMGKQAIHDQQVGWRHIAGIGRLSARYAIRGESPEHLARVQGLTSDILEGVPLAKAQAIVDRAGIHLYPTMADLIGRYESEGGGATVATASPTILIRQTLEKNGIGARVLGSHLGTRERRGKTELDGTFEHLHGEAKTKAIVDDLAAQGVELSKVDFYTDSRSDFPTAYLVSKLGGRVYVVNGDDTMTAEAIARGWYRVDVPKNAAVVEPPAGNAGGWGNAIWQGLKRRKNRDAVEATNGGI